MASIAVSKFVFLPPKNPLSPDQSNALLPFCESVPNALKFIVLSTANAPPNKIEATPATIIAAEPSIISGDAKPAAAIATAIPAIIAPIVRTSSVVIPLTAAAIEAVPIAITIKAAPASIIAAEPNAIANGIGPAPAIPNANPTPTITAAIIPRSPHETSSSALVIAYTPIAITIIAPPANIIAMDPDLICFSANPASAKTIPIPPITARTLNEFITSAVSKSPKIMFMNQIAIETANIAPATYNIAFPPPSILSLNVPIKANAAATPATTKRTLATSVNPIAPNIICDNTIAIDVDKIAPAAYISALPVSSITSVTPILSITQNIPAIEAITKSAVPKPAKTYSLKNPINTKDTVNPKSPSAKFFNPLENSFIPFGSNFIFSKRNIIPASPSRIPAATNTPFNAYVANKPTKTKLTANIKILTPISPSIAIFLSCFLSSFLVANISPSTINFNRGTITNIATPATINKGNAKIIIAANFNIE